MDDNQRDPHYLEALREHWMIVAVAVVLAIAGAVAFTHVATPRYEASTDVLVSPIPSGTLVGLPVFRDSQFGRGVVTAARLTKSPQVVSRVRHSLHAATSPSALSGSVTVTPQQQSDVLTITATSGSPERAATLANAFAVGLVAEQNDRFKRQLDSIVSTLSAKLNSLSNSSTNAEAVAISNQLAQLKALPRGTDPSVSIASPAVPPSSPSYPRPHLSEAIAAVLGLLIGIGIVFGRERLNPVVTRPDSIARTDGPPVLARMPALTNEDARMVLADLGDVRQELRVPMRTLWTTLGSLGPSGAETRTYLVTSSGEDEGSPAVSAVIAGLMARSGMSVALLDADLERGSLAAIVDGDVAFVSSIDSVIPSEDPRVTWIGTPPSGTRSRVRAVLVKPDDTELTGLSPERLSALAVDFVGQVDALVISAPPLPATQTKLLSDHADVVILTVALGQTKRPQLAALQTELAAHGVAPAGLVVLDRPSLLARARISRPTEPSPDRPSPRLPTPERPALEPGSSSESDAASVPRGDERRQRWV
jgi:capsular polysaccharide biosynthesis protein